MPKCRRGGLAIHSVRSPLSAAPLLPLPSSKEAVGPTPRSLSLGLAPFRPDAITRATTVGVIFTGVGICGRVRVETCSQAVPGDRHAAQGHRARPPTCHTSGRQCPLIGRRFAGTPPPKASRVVVNSLRRVAATISRGLSTGLAGQGRGCTEILCPRHGRGRHRRAVPNRPRRLPPPGHSLKRQGPANGKALSIVVVRRITRSSRPRTLAVGRLRCASRCLVMRVSWRRDSNPQPPVYKDSPNVPSQGP